MSLGFNLVRGYPLPPGNVLIGFVRISHVTLVSAVDTDLRSVLAVSNSDHLSPSDCPSRVPK